MSGLKSIGSNNSEALTAEVDNSEGERKEEFRPCIGAYFPCYRELTSANEILLAYRHYFPDNTVVMINDAGDEQHALLGEKYGCKYFHETENIGYPGGKDHHEQIIRWVKRFLHYIQLIDDEWFFLLEDDVFIMNPVNPPKYDINGVNHLNLLPQPSVEMIKGRGYHTSVETLMYGAMGGAIFRTSFFKEMATRIDEVERDLNEFGEKCPQTLTGQNWYYSDVVLSFLTYLYGGTLGPYPEFAEMHYRDLGQRLTAGRVGCLNNWKFLYKCPSHPNLCHLINGKYTIVLPTRGQGAAYELFLESLLQRYVKYIDVNEIHEFIVICPQAQLEKVKEQLTNISLPFTFYSDESLIDIEVDGWMKQQMLKLAICFKVITEHYLIIDDDLIITKPLRFSDFFDEKGCICYSYERTWPINGPNFATNTSWWMTSAMALGIQPNRIMKCTNLMGVTPQLMITRVVHQLLQALGGDNWINRMRYYRATEYCLYWIYLMKTLRTHYYTASYKFFAMDNDVNILVQELSEEEVKGKISKGIREKKYTFLVAQSWLKYPSQWIKDVLIE